MYGSGEPQNAFVAAGLGHITGQEGLQKCLRKLVAAAPFCRAQRGSNSATGTRHAPLVSSGGEAGELYTAICTDTYTGAVHYSSDGERAGTKHTWEKAEGQKHKVLCEPEGLELYSATVLVAYAVKNNSVQREVHPRSSAMLLHVTFSLYVGR